MKKFCLLAVNFRLTMRDATGYLSTKKTAEYDSSFVDRSKQTLNVLISLFEHLP